MSIVDIARGWDVRMGFNAEPPPPGNRILVVGQNGAFCEAMESQYGSGTGWDEWIVAAVKWLRGGRSTDSVWVSNATHDLSYFYGSPQGDAVTTVGATCRSALQAAGFSVTVGDASKEFDYATDGYGVLIVGGGDYGADPDWASGESDDDARGQQLVDYVNDGGAVLAVLKGSPSWNDPIDTEWSIGDSGSNVHNHTVLAAMTGPTAKNGNLFPSGLQLQLRLHHYTGIYEPDADAGYQEFFTDSCSNPYAIVAGWSGHDDLDLTL